MKLYQINFTQTFEETKWIEAENEEEANSILLEEWNNGEVIIHSTEECQTDANDQVHLEELKRFAKR